MKSALFRRVQGALASMGAWAAAAPSRLAASLSRTWRRLRTQPDDVETRELSEAGDVPGWVMVTLMTAGLVILIWALAGPALSELFQRAIDKLTGI